MAIFSNHFPLLNWLVLGRETNLHCCHYCQSPTSQPFYVRSGVRFPCASAVRFVVVLRIGWEGSVWGGKRVNQNYSSACPELSQDRLLSRWDSRIPAYNRRRLKSCFENCLYCWSRSILHWSVIRKLSTMKVLVSFTVHRNN